ncbi:MAG TPA: hypothetical protein EYQ24_14245 [Bacteroidetes bacterium]|nr:hypothetical protein [Bacteroidota bacterium]
MRLFLTALALTVLLTGCDLFGNEPLVVTYAVDATGGHGEVTLTYRDENGLVTVEDADLPFIREIEIDEPELGTFYPLEAESVFTSPGTLTTRIAGRQGGVPYDSDDVVTYGGDSTRTIRSQTALFYL